MQPIDTSFLPGSVNSLSYIDSYDSDFNFLTLEEESISHPIVKEGVKFSAKKISFDEEKTLLQRIKEDVKRSKVNLSEKKL